MSTASIQAACLIGIDAYSIVVEVHLQKGLPRFDLVGLPDNSIKESKSRVISAIQNTMGSFYNGKITVNLSPAHLPKFGVGFDLPIALGILAAEGKIPASVLQNKLFVGELSLNGELKPMHGILSIALQAKAQKMASLVLPAANVVEAMLVEGLPVVGVLSLGGVIQMAQGQRPFIAESALPPKPRTQTNELDLKDVKGQEKGKRALIIAAAGGHHLLFLGPPGTGKTMLATRLRSILPPLETFEALEVAKVSSSLGLPAAETFGERPFREPHHTISSAGLIGGGSIPRPGEVSLAHRGVLFLDELPEFTRANLDLLRQPLEKNSITISRAKVSIQLPCHFQLVAAMNPCPCGYFGSKARQCRCSKVAVKKYQSKVSGPVLDRIDLQVELPDVSYTELLSIAPSISSAEALRKILDAKAQQQKRFHGTKIVHNAEIPPAGIEKFIPLGERERTFFYSALENLHVSNRGIHRLLKISRTIADLEGTPTVGVSHLAEAFSYRHFDRTTQNVEN